MSARRHVPAYERLAEAVRWSLRRAGAGIERVEVPAPGVDPIDWLRTRPAGSRFYWRSRSGSEVSAASGSVQVVDADDLAGLKTTLPGYLDGLPPGTAFHGAVRFDPAANLSPEWDSFGRVRFHLPRFELRITGDGATLACHIVPADRENPTDVEASLRFLSQTQAAASGDGLPSEATAKPPRRVAPRRVDVPGPRGWVAAVDGALASFRSGSLEKVVLARRSTWPTARSMHPVDVLARVEAAAPGCFHVMLESDSAAFVSATPERLFRFEEGRIITEAVAGTIPLDAAGERQFSEKDHREHALVVDDVRDRLAPLVHQVEADPAPGVLALRRRRHLRTRMRGAPRDGAGALDVLAALHPTPAVGGSPREAAREFIASHEGFDRGLYAGVVGRIGRDAAGRVAADFVVGIRSALITDREIALYAGAGLVPGSDARAEWAEIEGKMSDLAQALGLPGFTA